jgi:hypothetical protein
MDTKNEVAHLEGAKLDGIEEFPYTPGTDAEKHLVRKIDRRLLPILWAMYIFNYLDRTNIGVSELPRCPVMLAETLRRL